MNRAIVYQAYSAFYSGDLTQYRQILETLQSQLKTREHTAKSTTTSIQPIAATAKMNKKRNYFPFSSLDALRERKRTKVAHKCR